MQIVVKTNRYAKESRVVNGSEGNLSCRENLQLPSGRRSGKQAEAPAAVARSMTLSVERLYFSQYVSTLMYSIWHCQSFKSATINPPTALVEFSHFTKELLRITRVSTSVVILALKYVHRLKSRCGKELQGKPGSEYRLLVCTLNLAMKYLVDNTYSNKTWGALSKIPVIEINLAEMEFIAQIKYDLHVPQEMYFAWLFLIQESFENFSLLYEQAVGRQCMTPPPEQN